MSPRGRLGRLVARLTGSAHIERLAAVDEKIGKIGRSHREDLAAHRQQLDRLVERLSTRASAKSVQSIERRLEDLQVWLVQQDSALAGALDRARLLDQQAIEDRRFARRIEPLLRHERPIIVGPWTGEVGFELLYWIPFVRWVVGRYRLDPARLTIVSRGGVAPWYGPLAAQYADVFSFVSPDEFRAATEHTKKQRRVGAFDAEIVARVRAARGLTAARVLSPGMMYRLFQPFWRQDATAARVDAYTEYARLTCPDDLPDLPREYVAARFYFSDCFPDTPANRAFVATTIETISRQIPVVLLSAPFRVDDHRDAAPAGDRIISISDRMTPERNLAVQTAVIARARAFVGTYGGYSYLAPFHGVSSLAFYSERTFKPHHLHLAQRVFAQLGGPTVVPLDTAELPLVQLALAGASVTAP